jgi:hypothetical protein
MIECNIVPPDFIMTDLTVCFGIILRFNYPLMNIFMAIFAVDTYLPEAPAFLFPVAIDAGYGQM